MTFPDFPTANRNPNTEKLISHAKTLSRIPQRSFFKRIIIKRDEKPSKDVKMNSSAINSFIIIVRYRKKRIASGAEKAF